jgi:hypothetical protein
MAGGRSFLCTWAGDGGQAECACHGFRFVTAEKRLRALDEVLAVLDGLKRGRNGFSFPGRHYNPRVRR